MSKFDARYDVSLFSLPRKFSIMEWVDAPAWQKKLQHVHDYHNYFLLCLHADNFNTFQILFTARKWVNHFHKYSKSGQQTMVKHSNP